MSKRPRAAGANKALAAAPVAPAAPARIALADRLDLSAAADLREALLAARGEDVVLGGGAVRHLGAPALQVLLAAARAWAVDGRSLSLEAPSGDLAEGLSRLGAAAADVTARAAAGAGAEGRP